MGQRIKLGIDLVVQGFQADINGFLQQLKAGVEGFRHAVQFVQHLVHVVLHFQINQGGYCLFAVFRQAVEQFGGFSQF